MSSTPATINQRKPDAMQFDASRDAAALLFADAEANPQPGKRLTDQGIADTVGVSRATITRWKRDPDFRAMVEGAKNDIKAEALKLPSAQVHERVKMRHSIVEGILTVFALRGQRYGMQADTAEESARRVFGSETPPEARTGLLVAQPKISASGKVVTEWAMDTGAIKALNDTLNDIAKDLGQTVDKAALSLDGGVRLEIVGMSEDELP